MPFVDRAGRGLHPSLVFSLARYTWFAPPVRPRPAGPLPHRRVLTAHTDHTPPLPRAGRLWQGREVLSGEKGERSGHPLRATSPPPPAPPRSFPPQQTKGNTHFHRYP